MKKALCAILLVLCLIVSCIPQNVYAAERTMDVGNGVILTEGKQYSFKNASSNWHMNVKGAGNANGTHVNLWPLDMSAPNSQCFTFKFVSTEEKIVMISPICASNKYLDVRRYGSAFAAGQKMCLWAADGDVVKNLVVEMQGDGTCYLTFSNNRDYCIGAVSATAAQTKQQQLVVCKKNGAAEQRWILCDSTGEPLNKIGIYQATIDMLDAVLAGLTDTKEVFSKRNNWIDDDYHEVYLPQLIQYTEQMKTMFVSFYDNAYARKDNSSMRRLIKEMQGSLDGAIRALKLYQDTTQVKWFGGSTLKRSIEEVISWFDWNSQEELEKIMEAFEDEVLQYRMDELVEKLRVANARITGKGKTEWPYFTTTGTWLDVTYPNTDTKCNNREVVSVLNNKCEDIFGSGISVDNFPAHLNAIGGSEKQAGYSCFGFANFAQWYIYKMQNDDVVSSKRVEVGGTYNERFLKDNLKTGDVIRVHLGGNNYHSMVIHSVRSNSIYVLHSNFYLAKDKKNMVTFDEVPFNKSDWQGEEVFVYRVESVID